VLTIDSANGRDHVGDGVVQETARIIVGMQVFVVGVELPKFYAT